MASIQDIANGAYRIGQSAKDAQLRTLTCADSLNTQSAQLAATVRGSRTGEDAVRLVGQAERSVRESAARLLTLQSDIDRFIQDLTK
jgi:cobalamin biosynthesis protein CbiD